MPLVRDMAQPVLHEAPLRLHKTLRVRALLQQTPAAFDGSLAGIVNIRSTGRPQSGKTARDIQTKPVATYFVPLHWKQFNAVR